MNLSDMSRDQLEHYAHKLQERASTLQHFAENLADSADFSNTKIPFHFKFLPDNPVLDLIPAGWCSKTEKDGTVSAGKGGLPTIREDLDLSHNLYGDTDHPVHRLLIGDNFHTMTGLTVSAVESGNANGVYDLIYIDPPYNTGRGDMVYNDRFASPTDPWFRTNWASFIYPRLQLAQRLLSPDGVIMAAIGINEAHRLRLIMDELFGQKNFISTVHWESGKKNDTRFVSNSVDYMLIYAKNRERLHNLDVRWREVDREISDAYFAAAKEVWESTSSTVDLDKRREQARTRFARRVKREFPDIPNSLSVMNKFDELGRINDGGSGGALSNPGGGGYVYDVIHPVTGQVVVPPAGGYRLPESTMNNWISQGLIEFGKDHNVVLRKRKHEYKGDVLGSVVSQSRQAADSHLSAVLGKHTFKYPKDHNVLATWFRAVAPKNAKILDFFGGSGSTAEAVLLLNKQDGGSREVTIVTDDFNNIGTNITRERIVRVMTGNNWADGKKHGGYGGRLAVYRVGAAPMVNLYDEESFQSWSRDAGLWAVFLNYPLVVEDTGKFLVLSSSDGERKTIIAYSYLLSREETDEMDERHPGAIWWIIYTAGTYEGAESYEYTIPYGDVETHKLPHSQQKIARSAARGAVTERATISHTEELSRLLNNLNKES